MADIEKAFEVGGGGILITLADSRLVWIGAGVDDPRVVGTDAPIGSMYYMTDGQQLTKTDVLATDWSPLSSSVFSGITPPILLNHNGNLSNGQLVGYTNLVNNPVVMGFRGRLVKITYINSRSSSDADFRFYKNTETPGNLFHTMSFTNQLTTVEEVSGAPILEVGDLCRIYFDDEGTNPNDMNMGLYFEAVPA